MIVFIGSESSLSTCMKWTMSVLINQKARHFRWFEFSVARSNYKPINCPKIKHSPSKEIGFFVTFSDKTTQFWFDFVKRNFSNYHVCHIDDREEKFRNSYATQQTVVNFECINHWFDWYIRLGFRLHVKLFNDYQLSERIESFGV